MQARVILGIAVALIMLHRLKHMHIIYTNYIIVLSLTKILNELQNQNNLKTRRYPQQTNYTNSIQKVTIPIHTKVSKHH